MRIGVIQATSQKDKNALLYQCTKNAVHAEADAVVNFGVFPDEDAAVSYVETAVCVSLLLTSGAVDFVVTGCSSGQGMMLACNSLPGVLCGYTPTPQDAFLFGRINGGNAVSLPLGLNFGWSGEINLQCTLDKLFDGPFGTGYPPGDAARKARDTLLLKQINAITKRTMAEAFASYDESLIKKALSRKTVVEYIMANGTNKTVRALVGREI
ncbi:MAG: RpiB/LacA/LacB family sugar-phosphate isomerase [Clostridia bacterium]|nr:RpiB/LacA/LacB family sugar-phosphate isomerase [Clostridia bacterium]